MKTILQIVLWLVCIVLGYMIFQSVNAPIKFNKVRQERFSAVIVKLKDIRDAQEAHKSVTGQYAKNFDNLIAFVDTAQYTITQQRDSSFMRYDKIYRIDLQVDTVVVDTLGFVKVRDSLFRNSDRYKNLASVPGAQGDEKFSMEAGTVDKGGFTAPVFVASVKKDVILYDQPQDLRIKENAHESIEEVDGDEIRVGSMDEVSTSGNWPSIYDRKK
ncbi:hypothetical protein BST99_06450 [Aureicoccus marinus]|uniref:Uncharacterized protein n=2 Tax=Aureicoccus marinus TaxID=754435 RepID=A0A2S7T676_9FLAO|nr:hypothetical protein BST99_06450 [Aureicoccus marinus]